VSNGARDVTTVAPQALFMMNSNLVLEQTKHLAKRLLQDPKWNDAERVRQLYEQVYGRPPTERETARALAYIRNYEGSLAVARINARECQLRSWQSLCHVILESNEFMYVE
jgi:hypothetical protein